MSNNRVQVRKRKGAGDWTLAHGGMIFSPDAAARLISNYERHGYEAEIVEIPARVQSQTFY